MKKKQACQMIAGIVSICAILSIISTVQAFLLARETGGAFPFGMAMMAVVTIVCTVVIWRGVRNMDE